jgi:hypothetical protein
MYTADINGLAPLANAVLKGHDKVVKLLVSIGGVDVNFRTNGLTPLFHAAERGVVKVVKVLLETPGIDVKGFRIRWDPVILKDDEKGDSGRDAQRSLTHGRMCFSNGSKLIYSIFWTPVNSQFQQRLHLP